jgi:membrane-associated phospholipid phosphatase
MDKFYVENTPEVKKLKKKELIIYWGLFIIFNIINLIWTEELFNLSIYLSKYFQQFEFDTAAYFFSKLFFHGLFLYIILAPFLRENNTRLFLDYIQVVFAVYFSNLIKMIYKATRPSFESKELRSTSHFCENDYGMPSAHTLIVIVLLLIISKDMGKFYSKSTKKMIRLSSILLMVCVILTRVYFGVHSLSQIFLGFFAGCAIYATFGYFEDYLCLKFILPFIVRSRFENERKRVFALFTLIWIFLNVLLLYFFFDCRNWENLNQNFFNLNNCTIVLTKFPNFSYRLYVFCILINHAYGMFFGIFLYDKDYYFASALHYERTNLINNIKRISLCFSMLIFMIFWNYPNLSKNGNSYASLIQAFLFTLVAGFMQSYGLFKIFDYLQIPYQRITADIKNK